MSIPMNPVYDTVGFGPAGGSRASRLVPYARTHELFRDLKSPGILTMKCGLSADKVESLTGNVNLFLRIPNIVRFGESGPGKSSVNNLIAGRPVASVSLDTSACTLASTEYRLTAEKSHFRIFDTAGLNTAMTDPKDYLDAVKGAHSIIDKLKRSGGVDLLLFCHRSGTLNDA